MPKLSVIGLDGVNWRILEHAIDKGLMPNLESVLEESYTAELETTYPSVTGPAWTSIVTGDNPGEHGVFDFVDHLESGRPYSSHDIDSETIHERIAEQGEVTVVNLPLSYPPRFDGEFVGSFLAPEDDYVRPGALKEKFDFSGYTKSISAVDKSLRVIEAATETASDKKRLIDVLLDDQDFFYTLFSAPDWIMHNHYREMELGKNDGAFQVFRVMDDAIGTVMERSENVILLSDHGFRAFDGVFYVNEWLRREGFLESSGAMESNWSDNRLVNLFLELVSGNSLSRKAARELYTVLEPVLPLPENVKVRLNAALSDGICMERSEAFCPSSGIRGIYINDERFEGVAENPDSLRQEIIERLPDYVEPIPREEVYSGEHLEKAPDIVFREDEYRISRAIYGRLTSANQVNHHGRKGFLVAAGENFETREERDDRALYDVAPTIAELFGLDFEADGEAIGIVESSLRLSGSDVPGDF
ncbi:MAG: alkaline phosphatase family protein [Candidatus Nanohaloarchaea archaeon]